MSRLAEIKERIAAVLSTEAACGAWCVDIDLLRDRNDAVNVLETFALSDMMMLVEAVDRLASLSDDLAANWDHDEESHRYRTTCRVCLGEAEEAWLRERGLIL